MKNDKWHWKHAQNGETGGQDLTLSDFKSIEMLIRFSNDLIRALKVKFAINYQPNPLRLCVKAWAGQETLAALVPGCSHGAGSDVVASASSDVPPETAQEQAAGLQFSRWWGFT